MTVHFHVSSVRNRDSIAEHGLDWRRMGAASGIAGSRVAEQEGCFLSNNQTECDFFVRMNNTGGPIDVWEVDDIDSADLVTSPEGFEYFPGVVAASNVRLVKRDLVGGHENFS